MPDRLNDTDPQSPAAMVSRTDPGLGSPPILVVGPTDPLPPDLAPPADASIEDLIDGITGPRPPPSSRRAGNGDSGRGYSSARPAPASQPMPRSEPAVVSPAPMPAGDRNALTVPRTFDTEPRGQIRRPPEESTVYTGRRAVTRNVVVVVLSAALFAAGMMGLLHWREQSAPRSSASAAIVVSPLPASPEVTAAPSIVIVSPPPPVETAAPPVAAAASPMGAPAHAAASATPKRGHASSRGATPAPGSLDDLNREISH